MRKAYILFALLCLLLITQNIKAQLIAKLSLSSVNNSIAAPVYIDLDNVTNIADSLLTLIETTSGKSIEVPFQVEHSYHRFLWWMIKSGDGSAKTNRTFELIKRKEKTEAESPLKLVEKDSALLITAYGKNVLQYQHAIHYPPKGVDTAFKRSGFLHPLWSPSGNVLTQINPPDHWHHVGIWNPWTDVIFRGKKVDFWNLGDKKGTVRFAHFISKDEGPVYAGFKALQEHVVLNDSLTHAPVVAMNEVWDVRVYNIGEKMWLWDFTSSLNCATDDSVLLKEYRYGGFGFRASSDWNNQNSKVLTSENKTRKDADASRARWCMIDGDMKQGHSGILFMGSPTNYNFPEPMRVWPENMNGRGDVFFSFSPTRNTDWPLAPGKDYVLKYRVLVYENTITPQQAEAVWKSFAQPPKVTVTIANK
ncbi:MAG: PmoA family protein [Ilyomonas sp.]